MRFFFVSFILLLGAPVMAAHAAENQPAAPNSSANCGASSHEALDKARGALAGTDSKAERHALVCLIEAVTRLEAENPVSYRGADQHPTIAVPWIEHAELSSNTSASPSTAKGKE